MLSQLLQSCWNIVDSHWPVQLQAWLIHLDDATLDVDTGSKKQRRHPRAKVHRGFHTSWRLNGMREKVVDLIRSKICPDEAAARRMKVLFTGEGCPELCCRFAFVRAALFMQGCSSPGCAQGMCGGAPQHKTMRACCSALLSICDCSR